MTEEFEPRFEPGAQVYFTDRHTLDVIDGYVFQHLGADPLFGNRYSVLSESRQERYSVWEHELTRWPREEARRPLYNLALLLCECGVVALVVVAARWLI